MMIEIIKSMLKLFFLFPIKSNRIVFSAYSGKNYSCNPKYITEALLKTDCSDLEIVWAFNNPKTYWNLNPRIRRIKFKSLSYIYNVLTARIVVDNVEGWSILPKRKGQTVINTWHGGGAYKGVGLKRLDTSEQMNHNMLRKHSRVDVYLSSSKQFTQQTLRESFQFKGRVLEWGMPRNDILIQYGDAKKQEIKKKLNLECEKKHVLFAPTFRNDIDYCEDIDFNLLLNVLHNKFGGEWKVLYRSHYYITGKQKKKDLVIDVTDYDDMQELLIASDALLTDYSSSIWDYSFMDKPAFLYVPDLVQYRNERQLYTPIETWPYPFALCMNALIDSIMQFDFEKARAKRIKHHSELGSFEMGTASINICNYIRSEIGERKLSQI